MFLVAGGWDGSNVLSSTETLVEGGQSWKVHQDLPTGRKYLRGISLLNTVIMTGKKKSPLHFYFQQPNSTGYIYINSFLKIVIMHKMFMCKCTKQIFWSI